METLKDIKEINKNVLEKICLAQTILDKIKIHPELINVQDPALIKLKDSRWNGHFIFSTLDEVAALYNAGCYDDIKNKEDIPQEVKKFVMDAGGYRFFNKN